MDPLRRLVNSAYFSKQPKTSYFNEIRNICWPTFSLHCIKKSKSIELGCGGTFFLSEPKKMYSRQDDVIGKHCTTQEQDFIEIFFWTGSISFRMLPWLLLPHLGSVTLPPIFLPTLTYLIFRSGIIGRGGLGLPIDLDAILDFSMDHLHLVQ